MKFDYDIVIVGGGMVGASLACALASTGLKIALVEALPLTAADQPSYDERTIALACGSKRIFETLGVWSGVAARAVAPIRRIHVSDRGRFGATRLDAADAGLEALGYVIANRTLGAALYETLSRHERVRLYSPARMRVVGFEPDGARVEIDNDGATETLTARLVAAADGADSPIRTAVGIRARRVDYDQNAIVTTVTVELPHQGTAYERFTDTGPLALLPYPGVTGRMGVVWSMPRAATSALLALEDAEFLALLTAQFGERLGAFSAVGKRHTYPLFLTRVAEHVRPRLALIGNAAHTVHPVAGQGFNLGLRDVAVLAEVLSDAHASGRDIGDLALLQRYADARARDNRAITVLTHSLIRIFSNDITPVAAARGLGLLAVDALPGVKRRITRLTSGLAGRLPRLARGMPL